MYRILSSDEQHLELAYTINHNSPLELNLYGPWIQGPSQVLHSSQAGVNNPQLTAFACEIQ